MKEWTKRRRRMKNKIEAVEIRETKRRKRK